MVCYLLTIILMGIFHQSDAAKPRQLPPSTSTAFPITTTSPLQWTDPSTGGKYGNPGARLHLSNKSIDDLHAFAAYTMAKSIQSMVISDLQIPIGGGLLIIKSPRITESKFADQENQFWTPDRVRSRFFGGQWAAQGVWQFKMSSVGRSMQQGTYRSTIVNGELNGTNQLTRTTDSKPTAQTTECKADLSQFRIEIVGAGNLTTVNNCDNPICDKIRSYFEDVLCVVFRTFVKEAINRKLATFPSRINIDGFEHTLDYGLLNNEPRVTDHIHAGLEGKISTNGNGPFGFSAPDLQSSDTNRMVKLEMSDYTFNTLLQTHFRKYPMSASDLLPKSLYHLLRLNCSSTNDPQGARRLLAKSRKYSRWEVGTGLAISGRGFPCLGTALENVTNSDQFASNATGDLVYKSGYKAPSIFVHSNRNGFFDASNGVLEMYGPDGQKGQVLARADVRLLRGDFTPKFNGHNITGSVNITRIQLSQSWPQSRSTGDQWLIRLTQFAKPILNEMFNTIFNDLAQFPMPMLDGFECASPEFSISSRTMQVDCDVRSGIRFG